MTLVVWVSSAIGFWVWIIILTRQAAFSKARTANRELARKTAPLLQATKITEAREVTQRFSKAPFAQVLDAGLGVLESSKRDNGMTAGEILQRAERAMSDQRTILKERYNSGSVTLQVVSAVSPVIAFVYSHQAAAIFAVIITAPALGYGIILKSKVAAMDTELQLTSSELIDYAQTRVLQRNQH